MKENDFFNDINGNDADIINNICINSIDRLHDLRINGKRCWAEKIEELTEKQKKYLYEIIEALEKQSEILDKYKKY